MTNRTTSDFFIAVRQRRAVSEHRSLYQVHGVHAGEREIGRGQTPVAEVQLMASRRLKPFPAPTTGGSFPIGATLMNGGANFSIFSRTCGQHRTAAFSIG